jgi:DNA-binding CsgD family transcriptional regulator/PAS domain-containing protein
MDHHIGDLPELLGHFYEAAANPDLWQDALDAFARAFGARGVLLPTETFVPGTLLHSRGMVDAVDHFFSEGWHEHDLRTEALISQKKTLSDGFVGDQALFSEEELEHSAYYRSFARSAGVPWFAAALLAGESSEHYVAMSLQRSAKEGPFEARDIAALDHILPHLRNAAVLAQRLAHMRGYSMVDGLEVSGEPAILVDRQGRVLACNSQAQKVMGDGLTIQRGRVVAVKQSENAALAGMIEAACRAGTLTEGWHKPLPIVLTSQTGAAPLVARVAPVLRSAGDLFGFTGAIVMLTQLGGRNEVPEEVLRTLFGLTKREAQIMSMVGEAYSVEGIARALLVSREAVRFHLKAVFSKTGVHRQSELVAIHAHLRGMSS